MTPIFCYGSINLSKIFGVKTAKEVCESLRPYLYQKDPAGDVYLNVTFSDRKEASVYGHTHSLIAKRKGVEGYCNIADLKEYIKDGGYQAQGQQQTPPPPSPPQGGYNGGYGVDF